LQPSSHPVALAECGCTVDACVRFAQGSPRGHSNRKIIKNEGMLCCGATHCVHVAPWLRGAWMTTNAPASVTAQQTAELALSGVTCSMQRLQQECSDAVRNWPRRTSSLRNRCRRRLVLKVSNKGNIGSTAIEPAADQNSDMTAPLPTATLATCRNDGAKSSCGSNTSTWPSLQSNMSVKTA
jgi:hypothetical protein